MPNANNMLFIHPINCHDCGNGFHALSYAIQHAQSKGFNVTDLSETQANKDPVYQAINSTDPYSIMGFGHGNDCRYTGDAEMDIFNCTECDILNGRAIYLLSCLTGNGLGPEIIRQGGKAYAGFIISWTWATSKGTDGDPYQDIYAKGFYESANELWMRYCDGLEFMDAVDASYNKYTEWINYWENSGDTNASECMKWLLHDRDGLVAYNECMLKQTESQCKTAHCYWYNDICNARPSKDGPDGGSPWWMLMPVIAVVGIALIVGQTTKTGKTHIKKYKS